MRTGKQNCYYRECYHGKPALRGTQFGQGMRSDGQILPFCFTFILCTSFSGSIKCSVYTPYGIRTQSLKHRRPVQSPGLPSANYLFSFILHFVPCRGFPVTSEMLSVTWDLRNRYRIKFDWLFLLSLSSAYTYTRSLRTGKASLTSRCEKVVSIVGSFQCTQLINLQHILNKPGRFFMEITTRLF